MNILRRLFGAAKRPNPTSQELTLLPTTPPVDQPSPPVITTIEGQEEHDPETLRRSLFAFI
jgi:hypothetical protein